MNDVLFLKQLHSICPASTAKIVEATGLSQDTVKKKIARIRVAYQMSIEYVRLSGTHGEYRVVDWGVINPNRLALA